MKKYLLGVLLATVASGVNAQGTTEHPLVPAPPCEEVIWDRLCVGMTKEELKRAYWRTDKDKTAGTAYFWADWRFQWDGPNGELSAAKRIMHGVENQLVLVAALTEKYGEPDSVENVTLTDRGMNAFGLYIPGKGVYTARKWTWKRGSLVITTEGEDDPDLTPSVFYYVVSPDTKKLDL